MGKPFDSGPQLHGRGQRRIRPEVTAAGVQSTLISGKKQEGDPRSLRSGPGILCPCRSVPNPAVG